MSEYCRAEYADGQIFERDYASIRGLKINGRRPVTLWLVNPPDKEIPAARQKVCPYVGIVYVGYTDV